MAAPIFKAFEEKAYKGLPVEPFRAPPGIRMVRIDRRSGKPVFGAWPSDDPLSPVIWEAFKPESEPRRAIKPDETVAEKPQEAAPVDQSRASDFLQTGAGITQDRTPHIAGGLNMATSR